MRMKHLLAVGSFALVTVLAGCNSTQDKMSLLEKENSELRDQLSQRDKALDAANSDLREANRMMREQEIMFDQELTNLAGGVSSPNAFEGIEGVSTSVSGREVTVTVASDVLFDSGRTSLKSNAKSSLDEVASVITTRYPGRSVQVIGHTDSDPIRKSGHKSNYHLGFERGFAVREYLISRGLDPSNVSITSYGPDQSLGSKSKSRRVEIVVAE